MDRSCHSDQVRHVIQNMPSLSQLRGIDAEQTFGAWLRTNVCFWVRGHSAWGEVCQQAFYIVIGFDEPPVDPIARILRI